VKLLPVGLVKTASAVGRMIATSILVVVVLPLVPETTTITPPCEQTPARAGRARPTRHHAAGRVDPLGKDQAREVRV
jgi:hypothetical protein